MNKTKKIIQKARKLDGMQYTGGYDSMMSVIEWVRSLQGTVWQANGHFVIITDLCYHTVNPNFWVIRDENVEFRVLTEEEFNEQFEESDED